MIPYHPRPKFSVRPYNFRLVPDHPDAQGLIFAGLGAVSGTLHFHDSSSYGNHGEIIDSRGDYSWDYRDGKPILTSTSTDSSRYILLPPLPTTDAFTMLHWAEGEYTISNKNSQGHFDSVPSGDPRCRYVMSLGRMYLDSGGNTSYAQFPGSTVNNNWALRSLRHTGVAATPALCGVGELFVAADQQAGSNDGVNAADISDAASFNRTSPLMGDMADLLLWDRYRDDEVVVKFADPSNIMLDGLIEPIPTQTYFIPTGAPPPPTVQTDIFESAIFGD